MRYHGALLVEAGSVEADPSTLVVELAHGTITEVTILFPPGPAGLVYFQVWHQARQIFPLTPGAAFQGDDSFIEFTERYKITGVPYWVELRGWAPNAELDHTIQASFTVLPLVSVGIVEGGFIPLPEGFL